MIELMTIRVLRTRFGRKGLDLDVLAKIIAHLYIGLPEQSLNYMHPTLLRYPALSMILFGRE